MLIGQLIKKISIRGDYSLNIELNFIYKQLEALLRPQKKIPKQHESITPLPSR